MSDTDTDTLQSAGLSPLAARFYAARSAVLRGRNARIKAVEEQCQAELAELRRQYDADRAELQLDYTITDIGVDYLASRRQQYPRSR
jgi:hypothetical protein